MAKAKNVFIKSKMNKDLDDRLIPPGEYRDGQNIQISRSEGADVGALENILGNLLLTDFNVPVQCCNVEIIGKYMDITNDRVIVFLTNFIDNSVNGLDNRYTIINPFPTGVANPPSAFYSSICVYNIKSNTSQLLVGGDGLNGQFLNFAKNHPIYHINLIENLLFWTDNRNQPRKINLNIAVANSLYYTKEDHISVAKYYPYKSIRLIKDDISTMLNVIDKTLPDNTTVNPYYDQYWQGDPNFIKDKFLRFSYRFKFEDGENSLMAPFTQSTFIPKQDGYFLGEFDPEPNDPLVPEVGKNDEDITFQSTEVRFFENKVNKITLLIESPDGILFSELYDKLKVIGIDILYKESDGLSCKVVETIPREVFEFLTPAAHGVSNNTNLLEYVYNSSKPYKTLPQSDTTRVFDKVPVRALTQEISGNRIIYGNFINKHTPPRSIDYNVLVSEKEDNKIEYPNHTLKQNRTYQVGIVLSDRYGRQSSVLLSSSDSGQTLANPFYSGSTVFNKYNEDPILNPGNNYSWPGDALKVLFNNVLVPDRNYDYSTGEPGIYNEKTNPLGWYSYKIVVKQQEQDYYNIYFPGVLNGETTGGDTQIKTPATLNQPIAHITLHGDNMNKVPRDLKNVGPDQKIFRTSRPTKVENPMWYSVADAEGEATEATFSDWNSLEARNFILQRNIELGLTEPDTGSNASLRLYLRVDNDGFSHTGHENKQFHPGTSSDTTVNIGTGIDLGLWESGSFPTQYYNPQSNPLCARLEIQDVNTGVVPKDKIPMLAIYETEPEISRLRLFWETTTGGLIAELNDAIVEASDTIIDPIDPTGGTWSVISHLMAENQCPWDAFGQTYLPNGYNKLRCKVSSIFSFSNTGGNIMGQGTGGANISLFSAERMNISGGWDDVKDDFGVQMWYSSYDGTGSVPAGVDPFQAFLYIKDTFWFSWRSYWNKYRFSFMVIDSVGAYIVRQLELTSRNIIPFGGWIPTEKDSTNPHTGIELNIGPTTGYTDPALNAAPLGGVYEATNNTVGFGPSYNYPRNWVEDGYPTNLNFFNTGINHSLSQNITIMSSDLEQYVTLGVANWIRLPVGNGSWFDGRNASNYPQWTADNYGGSNKDNAGELNIEVISQTIVRPVIPGDNSNLIEYTSVNGRPVNEFSISDYRNLNNVNSPYAVLESDFSNTLAADYVDGEIFKITIRYTDCWNDKGGYFGPIRDIKEQDYSNLEIK